MIKVDGLEHVLHWPRKECEAEVVDLTNTDVILAQVVDKQLEEDLVVHPLLGDEVRQTLEHGLGDKRLVNGPFQKMAHIGSKLTDVTLSSGFGDAHKPVVASIDGVVDLDDDHDQCQVVLLWREPVAADWVFFLTTLNL